MLSMVLQLNDGYNIMLGMCFLKRTNADNKYGTYNVVYTLYNADDIKQANMELWKHYYTISILSKLEDICSTTKYKGKGDESHALLRVDVEQQWLY